MEASGAGGRGISVGDDGCLGAVVAAAQNACHRWAAGQFRARRHSRLALHVGARLRDYA